MSNQWAEALVTAGMESVVRLQEQSADVSSDVVREAQLVDLSSLCVVDVTGDDVSAFLQGQFSNDLAKVTPSKAQITGYCTPKGRLLALPTVVGLESGFRLLIPADIKDGFLKRLSMFIMRAKVTVTERKDCLCTGVVAAEDESLGPLAEVLGALPGGVMEAASGAEQQIIRWHDMPDSGSRARYLVIAGIESQLALWQAGAQSPQAGQSLWRLGDIQAGIPSVTSGVLEAFVPQMLNLQVIDGLSFTKGCYPGQEIVARMQYLGKLKRHTRRFSYSGEAGQDVPVPGAALAAGTDDAAGVVVDAVAGPDGLVELLAVVKVSTTDTTLNFHGRELTARQLPYELPSLSDAQLDAV